MRKIIGSRRTTILTESDQDFKEQTVGIRIPVWVSRQGVVPGITEHKNKLSALLSSDKLFLSKKVPHLSQTGFLHLEFVWTPFRILLKI